MISTWQAIGLAFLIFLPLMTLMSWASFRAGYRAAKEDIDEPICGCDHHRSFHRGVGECAWHPDGYPALVCPCQSYIGPEAVPTLLWSDPADREADK